MPIEFPFNESLIKEKLTQRKNELTREVISQGKKITAEAAHEILGQAIIDIFFDGVNEYRRINSINDSVHNEVFQGLWNAYCLAWPTARPLRLVIVAGSLSAPKGYREALKATLKLRIPTFLRDQRIIVPDERMRLRHFQNMRVIDSESNNASLVVGGSTDRELFSKYWVKQQKDKKEQDELKAFEIYAAPKSSYNRHTKGKCCFAFIKMFADNVKTLLQDEEIKHTLQVSGLSPAFLIPLLYEQHSGFLVDYFFPETTFFMRYGSALSSLDIGADKLITSNDSFEEVLEKFCENARYNASLIDGPAITAADRERQAAVSKKEVEYRNAGPEEREMTILGFGDAYNPDVSVHEIIADDYSLRVDSEASIEESHHLTALQQVMSDAQKIQDINNLGVLNAVDTDKLTQALEDEVKESDKSNIPELKIDSEQVILLSFFKDNVAYFRQLDREDSEVFEYQLRRLWDAYVSQDTCPVPQAMRVSIGEKLTADNEQLVEFLREEKEKDQVFLDRLKAVLTTQESSYTPEQHTLAKNLQAVATFWVDPSVLDKSGITETQKTKLNSLYAEDDITRLRITVDWMAENFAIADKITTTALSENISPKNIAKMQKVFTPICLSVTEHLSSISRLYNKGGVKLDQLIVPTSLRAIFEDIPDHIVTTEDLEALLASKMRKILASLCETFQSIYPDPEFFARFTSQYSSEYIGEPTELFKRNSLIANLMTISLANIFDELEKNVKLKNSVHGQCISLLTQRAVTFFTSIPEDVINAEDFYAAINNDVTSSCSPGAINYSRFSIEGEQTFSSMMLAGCSLGDIAVARNILPSVCALYEKIPNPLYVETVKSLSPEFFNQFSGELEESARSGSYAKQTELVEEFKKLILVPPEVTLENEVSGYFYDEKIKQYLLDVTNRIVRVYGSDPSSKEDMQAILNSHAPLHIKLKLIGSIAKGKGEQVTPELPHRVMTWSAQKIYRQLSCFADVTEATITEKFTELLSERNEIDKSIHNIEREIQWYNLIHSSGVLRAFSSDDKLALIASPTEFSVSGVNLKIQSARKLLQEHSTEIRANVTKQVNDENFIAEVKKWLDFSQEKKERMNFDWINHLPKNIPDTEDEFVKFIFNLFTKTEINTLFKNLVTAEKQAEFVTALSRTLISYQPKILPGSETEKKIIDRIQDMFIPIRSDDDRPLQVEWQEYIEPPEYPESLINFFKGLDGKLKNCENVEKELWSSLQELFSSAFSDVDSAKDQTVTVNKVIQTLVRYHDDFLDQATFIGQFSAVLLQRVIYFLRARKDFQGSKGDLLKEFDRLIKSEDRDKQFGLVSTHHNAHTLTSMALARLSQPEIARKSDTLDCVLALDKNANGIEDRFRIKSLAKKIDKALRIKTVVNIWFSLTAINPETKRHSFADEAVLEVDADGILAEVFEQLLQQADMHSRYRELDVILPVLLENIIEYPYVQYRKDVLERVVKLMIAQYEKSTSLEIKERLVLSLARAAGKNAEATIFIADELNSLASAKKDEKLFELIKFIPKAKVLNPLAKEKKFHTKEHGRERHVNFSQPINAEELTDKEKGTRADIYRQEDESKWPVKFRKAESVIVKTLKEVDISNIQEAKEGYFNDQAIIAYLTQQLSKIRTAFGGFYEPEGATEIRFLLESNVLTLSEKLVKIGKVAQKKCQGAHVTRSADAWNFYKSLSHLADIKENKDIMPNFTQYIKARTSEEYRITEDIVSIENYIKRYQLILEGLNLIKEENFGEESETLKQLWQNAKKQTLSDPSTALRNIEIIRRFLQFDESSLQKVVSKSSRAAGFEALFKKWVDFSISSKEAINQSDISWIGALPSKDEFRNCYNYITAKIVGDDSEAVSASRSNNFPPEPTPKQKRDALFVALHQACIKNNRDGEMWWASLANPKRVTVAPVNVTSSEPPNQNLAELLAFYEEQKKLDEKGSISQTTAQAACAVIEAFGNSCDTLDDVKNALQQCQVKISSPKSIFSAYSQVPEGMRNVIEMIDSTSPVYSTADILLRLKENAANKTQATWKRGDQTAKVYEAIQKLFAPKQSATEITKLSDCINGARQSNQVSGDNALR